MAAAGAALALAGCARQGPHPKAETAPIAVEVLAITPAAAAGELVVPARVKALREATLIAHTAGRLTELPYVEGARFRRGARLARFDAPEIRAALDAATAGVEAARSRRETALRQEVRMDSLFATRVVSARDFEVARSEARAADAGWFAAESELERARAAHALVAPFDGVVVRRLADIGSRVALSQPVLEIRSSGGVEIAAAVPESGLELARAGRAWARGASGAWVSVRLARIEGTTDAATRTRLAYFEPPANWTGEPGAYARVRIVAADSGLGRQGLDAEAVLRVPQRSLVRRGALTGVYVAANDRAALRWIKLGRSSGDDAEVLGGLWPGDLVIVDPRGLADGVPVRVSNALEARANPAPAASERAR